MTTVKTTAGAVRGSVSDGVAAFKGIPYAASPFGSRRFRSPEPAPPWDGVRDALEFGPTAPKPPYAWPYDTLLLDPAIPGEECLNLNVWAPSAPSAPAGPRPVLVWLHSGAFMNGSGAVQRYDGSRFARDGVVVVTVNYRLGVEGFAYFADGGPANLGLRDQIAALEWVRDNIAAFGGDPGNVTLAGYSAGAMSTGALMSSPLAAGLFHRAVAMSGAAHTVITPGTATLMVAELATRLGVEPTREAIAAVAPADVLTAQAAVGLDVQTVPDPARWREVMLTQMPFMPVVDGEVLPDVPIARIAAGAAAGVPVLAGTTADESRLFLVPNGVADLITPELLGMTLAGYGLPAAAALAVYAADQPDSSAGLRLAAAGSDWTFRVPAIRLVEAQAAVGTPAWLYRFDWATPLLDGRLGACHELDAAFAFDTLDAPGADLLHGGAAPQALADEMHAAWVAFATSGDPGWAPYSADDRAVRHFGGAAEVTRDPDGARRELWAGIR
jgi:para-nitrobenzyl esterase